MAAVLDYLNLPPGWSVDTVSYRTGFVDFRLHNARQLYRRTIRVPEAVVRMAESRHDALLDLMHRQLIAQMIKAMGDDRVDSPILVGHSI